MAYEPNQWHADYDKGSGDNDAQEKMFSTDRKGTQTLEPVEPERLETSVLELYIVEKAHSDLHLRKKLALQLR